MSKRIIIRAHEHWHDAHQEIAQDWFQMFGYSSPGETFDWTADHYVHLGGINGKRYHLIVDIDKNHCPSPQLDTIPLEIYRLRKPIGKDSKFDYLKPDEHPEAYAVARRFTSGFTWGSG